MQHLNVKAAATATELGRFTALASVFGNVDRAGDRVLPGAFRDTIAAWQTIGRKLPVHWNHEPQPESVIGTIDPASMRETRSGLRVEGELDLDGSERAREAWRIVKSGSIGVSFGYLVQEQRKGADGANELTRLDVFEISLTPAPSNAAARIISWKSADDQADPLPSHAELECELVRAGIIARPAYHADYQRLDPAVTGTGPNGDEREKALPDEPPSDADQRSRLALLTDPELLRVREEERERMLTLLDPEPDSKAIKASVKAQQPVQIASFEC